MKLRIEIEMDNDAFEDCNGDEAGRILKVLAQLVRGKMRDGWSQHLRDINGNTVGKAEVIE